MKHPKCPYVKTNICSHFSAQALATLSFTALFCYHHPMKEQWEQHSFLGDTEIEFGSKPASEPRRRQLPSERKIREAIAPYLDVPKLRQLASDHERLEEALRTGDIPEEISWLLSLLATVLQPIERDQVKSPRDIASYLQVK